MDEPHTSHADGVGSLGGSVLGRDRNLDRGGSDLEIDLMAVGAVVSIGGRVGDVGVRCGGSHSRNCDRLRIMAHLSRVRGDSRVEGWGERHLTGTLICQGQRCQRHVRGGLPGTVHADGVGFRGSVVSGGDPNPNLVFPDIEGDLIVLCNQIVIGRHDVDVGPCGGGRGRNRDGRRSMGDRGRVLGRT